MSANSKIGISIGSTRHWRDPKRHAWLLGLVIPVLVPWSWILVKVTEWTLFWWWGVILVFGIIPVLDWVVGADSANAPESALKSLQNDKYYRWATFAYLPGQLLSLVLACWLLSGGGWQTMSLLDKCGLTVTLGIVGGIAINTAHELGHRRERVERVLSRVALMQTGYGHFYVEHNRGHHVRVATPEDPASSLLGESVFQFIPRSVIGGVRSACKLEAERLRKTGYRIWSLKNDVLSGWLMSLVLFTTLGIWFGRVVLPYMAAQAVIGFSLLEVVNYLEHYGLRRSLRPNGRYERVRPAHSWNSNNVVSNILLFHLQRHSDHHAHPVRRYQTLLHHDEAPQLPTGYAGMILLALVPPLWRRVMDPRVSDHYGGDLTLAARNTRFNRTRTHE
ncbi:alkane 1-monooxygenase [Mycobacteroides franklinii]|uniref:Alkane 1-monooxygenase n=1 Tax=Mycobacteroides franklinii TaxID=948102 RepID=A0A1S1LDS6_9MYCO|nr:alkane 1-monooxygenase [Mycobacteroides franklinii]